MPSPSRVMAVAALVLALVVPASAFTGPVQVANGTFEFGTAYNSERRIGADQNGNMFVAYSAQSPNGSYFVQVSASTDGGLSWRLLPGTPARANSSRSSLAVDSSGALDLVWTEGVPTKSRVYFSSFADGRWSPRVLISNSQYYSGYPSIASDGNGRLHVVWYGYDGEFYQIYYSQWNGSAWSAPKDLSRLRQDSLNPAIVAAGDGTLYVAWYAEVSHYLQVWYSTFDGNWSTPVPITQTLSDSVNPSLAIGPQGQVDIVWASSVKGVNQIFHISSNGGGWGSKSQLTDGTSQAETPTQAYAPNGTLYVFWNQAGVIYGCQLGGSCSPRLVYSAGYNEFPSAEWVAGGPSPGLALAWTNQVSATDSSHNSVLFELISQPTATPSPSFQLAGVLAVVAFVGAGMILARKSRLGHRVS